MIRFHDKFTQHYGGILKKKMIYQKQPLFGCGEILSYEWVDDRKGLVAISLRYLSDNPEKQRVEEVILSGIKKEREESIKERLLGKIAPPILPFKVNDLIIFDGYNKVYDLHYARERRLPSEIRCADRAVTVNHLRKMSRMDAINWVDDFINNKKFDETYIEQLEKRINGFVVNKENLQKSMEKLEKQKTNTPQKKTSKNVKTKSKDVVNSEKAKETSTPKANKKVDDVKTKIAPTKKPKESKPKEEKKLTKDEIFARYNKQLKAIDNKIANLKSRYIAEITNLNKQKEMLQQKLANNAKQNTYDDRYNFTKQNSQKKVDERER